VAGGKVVRVVCAGTVCAKRAVCKGGVGEAVCGYVHAGVCGVCGMCANVEGVEGHGRCAVWYEVCAQVGCKGLGRQCVCGVVCVVAALLSSRSAANALSVFI